MAVIAIAGTFTFGTRATVFIYNMQKRSIVILNYEGYLTTVDKREKSVSLKLTASDVPTLTVILRSLRTSGRGRMGVPSTPGVRGVASPPMPPPRRELGVP